MSKVKSRSDHDVAHLHPLTNGPTKYQLPTPHGFRDTAQTRFYRLRSLWQGQIQIRCTPTPPNQCPYQVTTSHTLWFPRYSRTRFSNSRSLRHGQRSNQGQTMMLHTYTSSPMSLLSINFLHVTVSEIQPGQTFSCRPPVRTPWVKTIPRQPLRAVG